MRLTFGKATGVSGHMVYPIHSHVPHPDFSSSGRELLGAQAAEKALHSSKGSVGCGREALDLESSSSSAPPSRVTLDVSQQGRTWGRTSRALAGAFPELHVLSTHRRDGQSCGSARGWRLEPEGRC